MNTSLKQGDRVHHAASGEVGVILNVDGRDSFEVAFPSGLRLVHPDELELLRGPADRLANGELGRALPYALRLQALYLRHAYRYDPMSGLSNARIEPTRHQIYVAHQIVQKLQPRMILADEVGLGKTVEAGLVIKELRARGLIERVLVVCPASLVMQWRQELRSKFNEEFEIIDGAAVKFLGRGGVNPWLKRDNVICSLPFASNPKRAEQIVEAGWDLAIFDEAHRVRRSMESRNKFRTTQAYRLADDLKEQVDGLLLLTATPMQLHPFELYSLIELVEPGLYPFFQSYETGRRSLPKLNDLMKALKAWESLSPEDQASVVTQHRSLLGEIGLPADASADYLDSSEDREALADRLVKRHPLSEVLVRNRKAEIGGFTRRTATRYLVSPSDEERIAYENITEYIIDGYNKAMALANNVAGLVMVTYQRMLTSSSHAIRESLRRRRNKLAAQLREAKELRSRGVSAAELEELKDAGELSYSLEQIEAAMLDPESVEEEIATLDGFIEQLGGIRDAKARELVKALRLIFKEEPDNKVIIFTQFLETQAFLQRVLESQGHDVALFNGQMNLEAKEDAVTRFRGPAQILISTEAGGEGRNFQFCHTMVNYDLPWNPMKVEQRIGRLDRIGQKHPVFIFNLACEGTIEERVLDVLERRIGLFEESVGSLDPILGEVESDIESIVMTRAASMDEKFDLYEVGLEQRVREARATERTLADFVLDRASLRRDIADELLGRTPLARYADLQAFVSQALDYFGGTLKDHSDGGMAISLSPRLSTTLRTSKPVTRGVFNWREALEREELDFFAFGHQLIDRIVGLPLTGEPVETAARYLDDGPAGTWAEFTYQVTGEALRPVGKFVRHLVNADGEVTSQELNAMPSLGLPAKDGAAAEWVARAVQASRQQIDQELAVMREAIQTENERVKAEELKRAERIFDYQRLRLEKRIREDSEWIEEKERSGSDRDRRVLPARRGKLEQDRERLRRLQHEFDQKVETIHKRTVGATASLVAAGLVVGR